MARRRRIEIDIILEAMMSKSGVWRAGFIGLFFTGYCRSAVRVRF